MYTSKERLAINAIYVYLPPHILTKHLVHDNDILGTENTMMNKIS